MLALRLGCAFQIILPAHKGNKRTQADVIIYIYRYLDTYECGDRMIKKMLWKR